MPQNNILPNKQTRAYELLELIAIFGEFPAKALSRLPGGETYKEAVVTNLKQLGLIKTYYRDSLRGLRLTQQAKTLLLEDNPERFSFYLDGISETNHIRSDAYRRERLHRIAEAAIAMNNVGVSIFRDEHPEIFTSEADRNKKIFVPAFYTPKEIKAIGESATKIRSSRSVGTLLTKKDIYITYNLGNSLIKWAYREEMRLKFFMNEFLCLMRNNAQYEPHNIKGIAFGNSMDLAYGILTDRRKNHYILNDNYNNFYFLTNDEKGELILHFLINPNLIDELNGILMKDFSPDIEPFFGCDTVTEDGIPVIFAYCCDLRKISGFVSMLTFHERKGMIICFDFQKEALQKYGGDNVEIKALNYEKVKRYFSDQ